MAKTKPPGGATRYRVDRKCNRYCATASSGLPGADRNVKRIFPSAPPGTPQGYEPGEARRGRMASAAWFRAEARMGRARGKAHGRSQAAPGTRAGLEHRVSARQSQPEAWQVAGARGPWPSQGRARHARDSLPTRESGAWSTPGAGGRHGGEAATAQSLTSPGVTTVLRWHVCRGHGRLEATRPALPAVSSAYSFHE